MDTTPVAFDERPAGGGARVGFARLDAPRTLNALSPEMIDALLERLEAWTGDPGVACIVLDGAGDRGFCAGGDVVRLRDAMARAGDRAEVARFYAHEYRLDRLIHASPKPVVCWGHGIVMGGGMGLMAGASHRIVTEASRLAMPEVSIGFYPDVGATWFLNRMPAPVGHFLGLTAAQAGADDALLLGLADYRVDSQRQEALYQALLDTPWTGHADEDRALASRTVRRFAQDVDPDRSGSPVLRNWSRIAAAMDHRGVAEILAHLETLADADAWLGRAAATLRAGSPTAACVILEQLRRGRHLSLAAAFERELRMSLHFAAGRDFPEGVRALLVDKDRAPRWQPSSLADVTPEMVERYFDEDEAALPADALLPPARA